MALKVWLPLNGDLENKGISDINLTSTAFAVDNNGKIGKCIKTTNSASINLGYDGNQINTGDLSFGGWFKISEAEVSPILNSGNYTSTDKAATSNLLGNDSYGGIGLIWATNNIYNSTFSSMNVFATIRTSSVNQTTSSASIEFDKWIHLFLTFEKSTGILSFYKNGVLINSKTFSNFSDAVSRNLMLNYKAVYGGNAITFNLPYYVNDVRIYDHCLSPLEVKEISQGLILHYKLNDTESSQNLVTTEDCFDGATCYNGATSKYGYGTNTDMYKTTGMFQGRKSTKVYMGTDGLNTYPYVYFNSFSATGTIVHTLSFDYFPTSQNKLIPYSYNGAYDWTYVVNGISGSAANAATCPALTVNLNQWNHIEITARKTDTTNTTRGIGYIRIGSAKHISTTTDYWLFANVQIEEKDHATPYMGIGGIRDAKVVDSSGYGNNGVINGNLIINNNTSKYSSSTFFDGNTAAIKIPFNDIIKDKNYTVSCWTYKTTIGTKNYQTILGGPSGFELEARSGGNTNPLYRILNWGGGTTPYEFNKWNHFCFVHTDADSKLYVNGELKITGTSANIPTGNYFIGSWSTATSQNYEGQMSDFRIYTTALSAEDILDLYHTPANIDNLGGIHGFETAEKQENIFRYELINPYSRTPTSAGSGEWVQRNGEWAINIRPAPFYQNLANSKSGFLVNEFIPNTQYIINLWIDGDDVIYHNNNVACGLQIVYDDDSIENLTITGGSKGFQHKFLITDASKSISHISSYYSTSINVYYRWDSYICPIDKESIVKEGLIKSTQFIENNSLASIHESGAMLSPNFIEK